MIPKNSVIATVFQLIRKRYGTSVPRIKETTFADLEFTKYDILYVVMGCEEIFDIVFNPEEVATLHNVRSVIDAVFKKLSAVGRLEIRKPQSRKAKPAEEAEAPAEETTEEPAEEAQEEPGLTDEQKEEPVEETEALEEELSADVAQPEEGK